MKDTYTLTYDCSNCGHKFTQTYRRGTEAEKNPECPNCGNSTTKRKSEEESVPQYPWTWLIYPQPHENPQPWNPLVPLTPTAPYPYRPWRQYEVWC